MSQDGELAARIAAVMGVHSVSHLRRVSGGASRETWLFDADGRGCAMTRLRAPRPGGMGREVDVLTTAHAGGVRVPAVIIDGSGSDALDRPFMIVEAVAGETIARRIQRDPSFERARGVLIDQMAHTLARLHAIDPAAVADLAAPDQVGSLLAFYDGLGEAHPVFDLAFRWLELNRPPTGKRSIVHGDFRLGNVVVDDDGLAAVLDWELAHGGDPMEDLGWLCVRAWRFGGSRPVAGLGTYDELFDAYERHSGVRPDPAVVRWWEVLGTVKWGVICIQQAHTHLDGVTRSHELAAIGRRESENEWDLLNLLEEAIA